MLLLKRHLVELVKAGKKRQTIRLWSGKLLKEGAISFTPGLGKMRITKVDELGSVEELTEADAVADGFASRKLLLEEIHRIYGRKLPAGKRVFRIGFEWPVGDGRSQEPEARSQKGSWGKQKTENRKLGAGVDGGCGGKSLVRKGVKRVLVGETSEVRRKVRGKREALRDFILAKAPRAGK